MNKVVVYDMSRITIDDILLKALRNDSTVEIELDEEYGFVLKVDGEKIMKDVLPYEDLEYPLKACRLTDKGEDLRDSVLDDMTLSFD